MDNSELPNDAPGWAAVLFNKVSSIQTGIDAVAKKIDDIGARVTTIERDVAYLSDKTNEMQLLQAHRDPCEIRISGIPRTLLETDESRNEAVVQVLTAMECKHTIKYIYKTRIFETKASRAVPTTHGMIAVRFSCTAARDDVVFSGRKLKDQTATKLFGSGGDNNIYVNQILPLPIHNLHMAARTQARALHYPPPVVNSSGVFMRRSMDAPLIPITLPSELQFLTPNQPSTQSSD